MLFKVVNYLLGLFKKPSRSDLNLDAVFENTLVQVYCFRASFCNPPSSTHTHNPLPNSTQEDLAPLLSPQLSISPNSFINVVVSLPRTVKTPKLEQREKEIPTANHKGAQTGVSTSS